MDPAAFADVIARYDLLPTSMVHLFALLLPMLEAVCGLLLIVNQMTKGATLVLIFLLTIFMGALGVGLIRGLDINCGCFSLSESTWSSLVWALIRNVLMLLVALWIFCFNLGWIHRQKSLESEAG